MVGDSRYVDWFLRQFIGVGGEIAAAAVGLFFFLSGYGLQTSYSLKGAGYLQSFFRHRMVKVFAPFAVFSVIGWVVKKYTFEDYSITEAFVNFIKTGNGFVMWFVVVLIIFYLLYYLIYKYVRNDKQQPIVMLLLVATVSLIYYFAGYGEWYYKSNLCFAVGLLYARCEPSIVSWYKNRLRTVFFTLSLITLLLAVAIYRCFCCYSVCQVSFRIILPLFLVASSYLYVFKRSIVLSFFGSISYEALFSLGLAIFILGCAHAAPLVHFVAIMPLTLFLAYLFHWLFKALKFV